jgi:ABC-type nickel/cobalt efflux system permease component RcnA
MNILRHLHTIGKDPSNQLHHIFDDDDGGMIQHANEAVVPANVTGFHNESATLDLAAATAFDGMEHENMQRAITMSVLFSTLMILYTAICCYYQKLYKIRRRIGDTSTHAHSARQEQRSNNQAVLDESTGVAQRAMNDEEMGRKLEERKRRIHNVLLMRMVVEEDFANGQQQGRKDGSVKSKDEEKGAAQISPDITLSASDETQDPSHVQIAAASTPADTNSTNPPAASPPRAKSATSSSTCMDFKRYTEAFHSSLSNCSSSAHCTHHTNTCSDSTHHNTSATLLSVLHNEECNICLSEFQVGDRIAWSCKNKFLASSGCTGDCTSNKSGNTAADLKTETICRHVFHSECIERWLLVREGCPVCRRSYFEDEDEASEGNRGNAAASRVIVVVED